MAEQLALRIIRDPIEKLSDEQVLALPSLTAAILKCMSEGGWQPKYVCLELDIDPAVMSKIQAGTRNFPVNKLIDLMDLCGNEIPLRWQALRRGYGMVRLKSRVEAELEAEREKNAELQRELETITKFMRNVRA